MRKIVYARCAAAVLGLTAAAAAWRLTAARADAPGARRAGPAPSGDAPRRPGGDRPVPVQTAAARTATLRVTESALGTVVPRYSASVKSRVTGQLVRVHFAEGDLVKEGQILAELDARTFQADLKQIEGQLVRDRALLANAILDFKRYEALGREQIAARGDVEARESLVKQYEGALAASEGQRLQVALQLGFTRVTAPISGRIGLRLVDPGNIVSPGDPTGIAVINSVQPISVVFTLPEDAVPRVMERLRHAEREGDSLPVEAWDKGSRTKLATGKLLTIDNQIDPGTGTVKLKAEFPNEDLVLFPNQFVNVRLLLETQPGRTLVPVAAIQRGSIGAFAYVVAGTRATIRKVKVGPSDGPDVSVEDGLAPGEVVVTSGADRLREGALVAVMEPGARRSAAGPPRDD